MSSISFFCRPTALILTLPLGHFLLAHRPSDSVSREHIEWPPTRKRWSHLGSVVSTGQSSPWRRAGAHEHLATDTNGDPCISTDQHRDRSKLARRRSREGRIPLIVGYDLAGPQCVLCFVNACQDAGTISTDTLGVRLSLMWQMQRVRTLNLRHATNSESSMGRSLPHRLVVLTAKGL